MRGAAVIGPRRGVPAPSRGEAPHLLLLVQQSCLQLPALAAPESVLQSAETRLQSTAPGPERVVFDSSFHSPNVRRRRVHAAEEAFLARKSSARSVIELQQKLPETSARFTGIVCSSERPPPGVRPPSQTSESLFSAGAYYQKIKQ